MSFGDDALSYDRLRKTVEAARDCGFAAVSSNDHFVFQTPWLDGPTALAAAIEHSGDMELATTISLAVLRGPVALAKTLAALDVLSDGRVLAALGPGSSQRDYELFGIPFEERWRRFDEVIAELRDLLEGDELAPRPVRAGGIPLWVGSWGSPAGLRRVARAADGWLASAYNTTPERFAEARGELPAGFPSALATMWTWITEDRADEERVLDGMLAPLLKRDPVELREQVCVGSAEHCGRVLAAYAEAGCDRVYVWPLGDEPRQLELATEALAAVSR
jgi:alkanesulfonate monooxygenase SsuD/methylene tetrahydromethanopterin reductase-like flavin-dependent oxidoreductase (luciferase family)